MTMTPPKASAPPAEKTCSCRMSDAWRCAVDRHLISVSCQCKCHRAASAQVREQIVAHAEWSRANGRQQRLADAAAEPAPVAQDAEIGALRWKARPHMGWYAFPIYELPAWEANPHCETMRLKVDPRDRGKLPIADHARREAELESQSAAHFIRAREWAEKSGELEASLAACRALLLDVSRYLDPRQFQEAIARIADALREGVAK